MHLTFSIFIPQKMCHLFSCFCIYPINYDFTIKHLIFTAFAVINFPLIQLLVYNIRILNSLMCSFLNRNIIITKLYYLRSIIFSLGFIYIIFLLWAVIYLFLSLLFLFFCCAVYKRNCYILQF